MPDDVFRWVIAIAVALACLASVCQAILVAALYRSGKEVQRAGKDAQNKIAPLLDRLDAVLTSTGKILDENRPRIADITAETLVIAKVTRQQAERLSELLNDANQRARARIAQIDRTVDETVAQVEHARSTIRSAITRPAREASGIVAGIKAAASTYAQGGRRHSPEHITQDEEMFI